MARTARNLAAQAAIAGLLAGAGCANIQEPPGGPPDFAPPVLLAVTPDSGAVLEGFDDAISFQFDEVISETSGGGLDRLFRVSPRHERLDVDWKRSRLTVRPDRGWRPGITYQVTMLPGIADLRQNRMMQERTIVFSTGGPIPNTTVEGTLVDWERGQLARGALIELIRLADSLTYTDRSDTTGRFTLIAMPPGDYVLVGTVDANSNGRRDPREAFDSTTVTLDSAVARDLWAFVRDTTGPRITQLRRLDSLAVGITFDQALALELPEPEAVSVRVLPDSLPVTVTELMTQAGHDSLRAAARADSARADSAAADTAAVAAPPPPAPLPPPPDTSAAATILDDRPALTKTVVVRLAEPLRPGERYVITATVRNLLDARGESAQVLVVPEEP